MAEDEIEFKCDLGYQLSSDYRRSVCKQKTASWSNPLPKCLRKFNVSIHFCSVRSGGENSIPMLRTF